MRTLTRIADLVDQIWRGAIVGALEGIGLGVIAAAVAREYGRWSGIWTIITGLAVWLAYAVWAMHARPFVIPRTPPRAVVTPPADRADPAVVLAAIEGRGDRRLMSFREQYQYAVACTHDGQPPQQIARQLRCSEADVALLLAIAQPTKAAIRR